MFFYCVTGIHHGIEIIMKIEDLSIGLKIGEQCFTFYESTEF